MWPVFELCESDRWGPGTEFPSGVQGQSQWLGAKPPEVEKYHSQFTLGQLLV